MLATENDKTNSIKMEIRVCEWKWPVMEPREIGEAGLGSISGITNSNFFKRCWEIVEVF